MVCLPADDDSTSDDCRHSEVSSSFAGKMEGDAYGLEAWTNISGNFDRLNGGVYLDHAGTTLYSNSLLESVFHDLSSNCFGNPHSRSSSSKLTSDLVDQTRAEVLRFFNADTKHYTLIFTSGATHSLKLVAESFLFSGSPLNSGDQCSRCGSFFYLKESHTSVVGMREVIRNRAPVFAIPTEEMESCYSESRLARPAGPMHKEANGPSGTTKLQSKTNAFQSNCVPTEPSFEAATQTKGPVRTAPNSLFVFPAQCNFSGYKYPLEWIEATQRGILSSLKPRPCINSGMAQYANHANQSDWYCLLDAASYVGTNPLDLSVWRPDFVTVSFYKILGYPTGIGALIVNRRAIDTLKKTYFGGGTVEMFAASRDVHVSRQALHERFTALLQMHYGTVNFLSILSLRRAISNLTSLVRSMENVSTHTFYLGKFLYDSLLQLKHRNGRRLVEVYTPADFTDRQRQGAIVAFNLMDENGDYIGYVQVEKILALHDIHVRTGCFCNPAACQRFLHLSDEEADQQFMSGHKCGDENDLIDGKPTGAVRVSFGYMSRKSDVMRLVDVIDSCFLKNRVMRPSNDAKRSGSAETAAPPVRLVGIHVYPVKSCGAFSPQKWRVCESGLLYDRKWVIVNSAGAVLTQKREPKLCLIRPVIDLSRQALVLTHPGVDSSVSIPLEATCPLDVTFSFIKIGGKLVQVSDCGPAPGEWLSSVLHMPALRLLKYEQVSDGGSLANDSPLLLINRKSVLTIQQQLTSNDEPNDSADDCVMRFRGNLVIDGAEAFEEENWKAVSLNSLTLKNAGSCYRCQMICIDQNTAARSQEHLIALANVRGKKVPFGIHLEIQTSPGENDPMFVQLGCPVRFS